jgi:hypothetical protein
MAELIAAYSPPMPEPARTRKAAKLAKFQENAVATVKMRYTPSVTMKSFLRPTRSVRYPKRSAPATAPAR